MFKKNYKTHNMAFFLVKSILTLKVREKEVLREKEVVRENERFLLWDAIRKWRKGDVSLAYKRKGLPSMKGKNKKDIGNIYRSSLNE